MANVFRVILAADGSGATGGFNATPTGVHQGGEVYSIVSSIISDQPTKIYFSDSTATGSNGGEIGKIDALALGTSQMLFDPPVSFEDGLQVDVSATGDVGSISVYWSPFGGRAFSG